MAVYYPKSLVRLTISYDTTKAGAEGGVSEHIVARPQSFTVNYNGYKEADTFDLVFDAQLLPVSPDVLRNANIEIIAYASDELIEDEQTEANHVQNPNNLLIVGLADNAKISFDNTGRWFSISGRDYTSLMIDKPWNPKIKVPVGQPIKDTVQYLVDIAAGVLTLDDNGNASKTGRQRIITVILDGIDEAGETDKADETNPTGKNKSTKKGKLKQPKFGYGKGKSNKKGVPQKPGSSVWDVIYRMVMEHGLIVYVNNYSVVIANPKVLSQQRADQAIYVAYGRNLTSIELSRKLGKETVPQIKVVSYDPDGRKPVSGIWPKDAKVRTTAIGTKEEIQVYTVPGLVSEDACKAVARRMYEERARGETALSWATKNLTDLNDQNILAIRAGQPIRLGFDDIYNADFYTLNSASQRKAAMVRLGYASTVAAKVAAAFDAVIKEKTYYYTKTARVSFDNSSGISIEGTCINYVSQSRDDNHE